MVEGGTSGSGGQSGSSTSSHSSSSSGSSKGRDTKLLIRVSTTVQTDRIHSFFDRSLALAKPPVGAGFVRKVSRKSDDTVVVSIEDASIARRLVSSFSDSRPKIDGHEFTIELYSSDHSKSLSSPSNHNGDKRREKESSRMSWCASQPSSSTSKRSFHSSPSTSSRPSTSTHDSTRTECAPSSSSACSIPMDPYHGIVGVTMSRLASMSMMCEKILKEVIIAAMREMGGYLSHSEDSGIIRVLLKRTSLYSQEMPQEGTIIVQGEETSFTLMPTEDTHKMYDRYLSSEKCRESVPSTSSSSSSSSSSIPSTPECSSRRRDALSYDSSRTIFVPSLPKGVTKDFIRKKFHKMGAVLDSELKNIHSVSPHAILQFNHTQAAVMAMEEYEREQMEEEKGLPSRNRKRPHFIRSSSSHRVWVANLPPQDEDYVKKKLLELLKGANNPTIVVDLRRREGIIDLMTIEKAKHFLEIIKSSPLSQQGGSVHTWLVADYCSDRLYEHFIERRGLSPSAYEVELISALAKMHPNKEQKTQAEARMERMKGGEEKMAEKKRSMNGENGNHSHSPSSSRHLNGEGRRSGDSGFSEDRKESQVLDSDDDEMLERKWRVAATPNDRREENGVMKKRLMRLGEDIESFYAQVPQKTREKKEVKEEEEGEKKENEKIPTHERFNNFREALLNVNTPLKARSIDDMVRYRSKDPLRSPPIPISPLNGDRERNPIVTSPPSGSRPAPLHINIPPSTSTAHSNSTPSPYTRLPPTLSTNSSRHPSISTPSTLTPRSHTMPTTGNRPPFPNEHNGDHPWNSGGLPGSNAATPTSSRLSLSRRESVCSNSSQSHTPLPPSIPSTSTGGVFTPSALKSPPVSSWNPTANAWKGGPSLASPIPSSINRSRASIDSHHKPSTPSLARPPGLPKPSMEKCGFGLGPSSSLPKTPSLPRSSSMNDKKPIISREGTKDFTDIVDNIIQNKNAHMKITSRIPKKENRGRDEKEERKEKKREEKDRERSERKEKKEDRKKSRENETKEEKAKRKELKRKEREKEERKKSSTNDKEKKRKSIDGEKKKKKKQKKALSESDSGSDSDDGNFKPSSSNNKQILDDEAFARSLAASSMYDRVKVRRSGSNKEEKKKIDALEAIRKKKEKKTSKKRALLSSSTDSEEEAKERGKKGKREEEEESSEEEEEEKERVKKEKKKEKKRRESSEDSDSEEEREKKRTKKEKKVLKKNSTIDLFSDRDDNESVKSEKKEKLSKKRSLEKDEKGDSPCSSSHPPPEKKVKKEETSSSDESEDEGERSSKKSEVSTSSWRGREEKGRRLSESSVATHSEKDEVWKSPASGSGEKEIKEEPKEDRAPPRLMTKAAMKEFNVGASSSPAGSSWMNNREEKELNLSSEDSSQSSSDSEEEKEEIVENKEDEEMREEKEEEEEKEEKEEQEEKEEERDEEEKVEEEIVEMKEEGRIEEEEEKEEERMEEEEEKDEEEVKKEVEDSQSMEKDEEAESAIRGLELPSDDVLEETEKAVESIFDEEEEPEVHYPSNDFLHAHDMNLSSSSSQCSSPKIPPSSLTPSLLLRPTPLHPSSISSPTIHSPNPLHHHLLQSTSHSSIPPVSSPLVSPHLITSPSTSRPASIHQFITRPISQESSSQHVHDENGVANHQEKVWTPQGSSSDGGPSPSPSQPSINKEQIARRFPLAWDGQLKMKAKLTTTQWRKLHGDDALLNMFFNSAPIPLDVKGVTKQVIEVNKKMRLDNEKILETTSIDNGNVHACLIVIPAGITTDEVNESKKIFSQSFVSYFRQKAIAGITEFADSDGPQLVAQFFSPGQFVTDYLSPKYPDFLDLLHTKHADEYLLVLIKSKEE